MFTSNRTKENLVFSVGRRIYYLTFQISDDNSEIKYGACIFRANKNHMRSDIFNHETSQHLLTSEKRFNNFPVITNTTEKMCNFLNNNRTRRSRKIAIESKLFKKQCIKLLIKHSVRSRGSKHKFLQERNLHSQMCSIKRRIKRVENNLKSDLSFSEKLRRKAFHQAEDKNWREIQLEDCSWVGKKNLNQFYFRRGNRMYFVLCQYNYQTGHLVYGASIFKSKKELYPSEWYDSHEVREKHFSTAYQRFSNYPVTVALGNCPLVFKSPYKTRSYYSGMISLSKENMDIFRQVFCCFGVRKRSSVHKFLSVNNKINQCNSYLKHWKAELNCCQQELIEYNAHKKIKKHKKRVTFSLIPQQIFIIYTSLIRNVTNSLFAGSNKKSISIK
jgi:hypothetical protein